MKHIIKYAEIIEAFTDPALGPPHHVGPSYAAEKLAYVEANLSTSPTQGTRDPHRAERLETAKRFWTNLQNVSDELIQFAESRAKNFHTGDIVSNFVHPFVWGAGEIVIGIPLTDNPVALAQEAQGYDLLIRQDIFHFLAGHDTTIDAISNGILTLILNPTPITDGAITETLRHRPSLLSSPRLNTDTHELTMLDFALGNKDPDTFPNPHLFDPTRMNFAPLAFGGGTFTCLGIQSARYLMTLAIKSFFAANPHPTLIDFQTRQSQTQQGLDYLVVTT